MTHPVINGHTYRPTKTRMQRVANFLAELLALALLALILTGVLAMLLGAVWLCQWLLRAIAGI